jgi:hypothetical protein
VGSLFAYRICEDHMRSSRESSDSSEVVKKPKRDISCNRCQVECCRYISLSLRISLISNHSCRCLSPAPRRTRCHKQFLIEKWAGAGPS